MKSERVITCINCPMGCRLTVKLEDGKPFSIIGNTCKRGEKYGYQEVTEPVRMVTAVVPVEGSKMPVSVKTAMPIPKDKIRACMMELAKIRVKLPIHEQEIILANVCGTGVNIIATRSI